MPLYPLRFRPRFVEKIWGGRKLETVLGKSLPAGKNIGESWELFDFPPGVVDRSGDWISAVVENGPLAGRTLHQLMTQHNRELMGSVAPARDGQFPLLIKFLDAREDLSVQVHPDQKYADENPDAHLKSEAWYVFQHEPGARLLKGLTAGVGPDQLAAAISAGTVEQCIQAVPVKDGDCYYLPSGTVHALGAGILVAEVQTPSDTTFRVYDFDRIEPSTGKPRQLHVEQALACIDFTEPVPQRPRTHVADHHSTVSRLVDSEHFRIEKVRFNQGSRKPIPYAEPVVWMMLDGKVTITVDTVGPTMIDRGQTVLLPAAMGNPVMTADTDAAWLEVTFPVA